MIVFTKEERLVLLILGVVVFVGSTCHFVFKKYPRLHDIVNVMDNQQLYRRVDVNRASRDELIAIPYIGPYTADKIIERRERRPFETLDELKSVSGVKEKNFEKFKSFLRI